MPQGTFIVGDMRSVDLNGPFDGIVAWDSVFHLPRTDHAALFARMCHWLRPDGRLLISLAGSGDLGFTSEMHGSTFFNSGHEPADALAMLTDAGFRIEHWEVDDPSSRGHIAIVAVRDAT